MSYTKGPWRVDQGAVFGDDGVDGDRMVASCTGYTRNFDSGMVLGQNVHNAHLIAAAPDMYEALKALRDFETGPVAAKRPDVYSLRVKSCMAALEKAEGK